MLTIYNTIYILYLSFSLFDGKPSSYLTLFNFIIPLYNTVYYIHFYSFGSSIDVCLCLQFIEILWIIIAVIT